MGDILISQGPCLIQKGQKKITALVLAVLYDGNRAKSFVTEVFILAPTRSDVSFMSNKRIKDS